MQNEPQLSAEMEKRFDEEFNAVSSTENPLADWWVEHHKKIKHFLASVLEEQKIQAEVITTEIVARAVADERQKLLPFILNGYEDKDDFVSKNYRVFATAGEYADDSIEMAELWESFQLNQLKESV
jgi:hypothetical protein